MINENWTETKTALMEGLEGNKAKSMETVLENTKTYLAEALQGPRCWQRSGFKQYLPSRRDAHVIVTKSG